MAILGFTRAKNIEKAVEEGVMKHIDDMYDDKFHPIINNHDLYDYFDNLNSERILKIFKYSAPVFACIDLFATANKNKKYVIKDARTNEIIPKDEKNEVLEKIRSLIEQPNPLQSGGEYEQYAAAYYRLFGNSYDFANTLFDRDFSIKDVKTLTQLPAQYVKINASNVYFRATTKEDIIKNYQLCYPKTRRTDTFATNKVLHANDINLEFDEYNSHNKEADAEWLKGIPRIKRIGTEIQNNKSTIESLNTITENRGSVGLFTPDKRDETGSSLPMTKSEKDTVDERLRQYGLLRNQKQYQYLDVPMKFQKTGMTPTELGIFEAIAHNWITVATIYGIPKLLVAQYTQGATYENQEQSLKELYVNNVIPYSQNRANAMNKFLKLREFGYYLDVSFGHLPFLQSDKKDNAIANRQTGSTYKELFFAGGCNYNMWLNEIGQPNDTTIGSKYIWQLNEKQTAAINQTRKT